MRTLTTAAKLNEMIQQHIDSLLLDDYLWHSDVYLHPADRSGCNWNIEVNCNGDAPSCGPVISDYLDAMRSRYVIPADDETAVTNDEKSRSSRRGVSPLVLAGICDDRYTEMMAGVACS